jgi:hypothetical protein
MHVLNEQDCDLIVGDVTIRRGQVKPIPAKWEPRVQELADAGVLTIQGAKPAPSGELGRGQLLDLIRSLTPAERKALLAEPDGAEETAQQAVADPTKAGLGAALALGNTTTFEQAPAIASKDAVGPEGFANWHINRVRPWVLKCTDRDLLERLSAVENRDPVLEAILERLQQLDAQV